MQVQIIGAVLAQLQRRAPERVQLLRQGLPRDCALTDKQLRRIVEEFDAKANDKGEADAAAVTAATGVTAANWSNLWVVIIICAAAQLLALLAVLPVRKRVDAIAAVMPRAQQAMPAVI